MSFLDPSEVPDAPEVPLTTEPVTPAQARRALYAVYYSFAVTGFAFASWASRIPDVKLLLDLSPGQLSRILLAAALASVISLPMAGTFIARLGARRTVERASFVFGIGMAIAAVGLVLANQWVVIGGQFVVGLGMGTWDVSMNHAGAAVERARGKSTMPWFHAAFSLSTVVAALIGTLMTYLQVPIWAHLSLALVLVWSVSFGGVTAFLPEQPTALEPAAAGEVRKSKSAWTEPRTLLIGFVVLVAAFAEGSANDWLAIAFTDGHDLPTWAGVAALSVFLTAMTLGRILGTGLLDRYGRVPVLLALFAFALVGSLLVIFGNTPLAYLGAVLWGVGASLGFPVGMSAATDNPKRAAARLSVVSTIGYMAFLGGPALLGYLGDQVGVLYALLAVGVLALPAMLAVPAMKEQRHD